MVQFALTNNFFLILWGLKNLQQVSLDQLCNYVEQEKIK